MAVGRGVAVGVGAGVSVASGTSTSAVGAGVLFVSSAGSVAFCEQPIKVRAAAVSKKNIVSVVLLILKNNIR